jgi:hypothetical protein
VTIEEVGLTEATSITLLTTLPVSDGTDNMLDVGTKLFSRASGRELLRCIHFNLTDTSRSKPPPSDERSVSTDSVTKTREPAK